MPCKAKHPLQGMKLQEKEAQKDQDYRLKVKGKCSIGR